MHDGWRVLRLGDAVEIKHGFAFPGSELATDPSYPTVVTPGNFRIGGGFQQAKIKTFTGDVPDGFVLQPGELIVTMTDLSKTGDTLGYPALVPGDRTYLHNQRIGKVILQDSDLVDLRYVSLVMQTSSYRAHVLGTASGSTVRHTSPGRILDFKTAFPPMAEQRRIAGVLGALDDLIDTNRRLVRSIARSQLALFQREWDGASRSRLDQVALITMGQSPPGESYNERGDGTPFYQGTRDFGWRYPSRRVWTTQPTRLAAARDVLVAVRAPVGELNIATETTALGRGVASIRALRREGTLFQALQADPRLWDIHQGTGTVFASINKADMSALSVPWVDGDVLEASLAGMDAGIADLEQESVTLTLARDELLPLLLSGRVRVNAATESLVG